MNPSPDVGTGFFDIVARFLQGDIVASYLFILFRDYVILTCIDKKIAWLRTETHINRRYLAEIMTDADYADDQAFLENTSIQAE